MDFNLSDEQQQLRDAVRRYLAQEYGFEARRAIIHGDGTSAAAWQGFAELGLLGVPVPEAHGGFGGNGVDLMVVMEEFGRALVVEPYFATAVMSVAFLKAGGSDAQKAASLPAIAEGRLLMAAALTERQSRHELFNVETRARVVGDGFVLDGHKTVVLHGGQAQQLIVSARSAGDARDLSGLSLFVVPRGHPGVTVSDYRTIDGMRAADVTLTGVKLPRAALLGPQGGAWAILESVARTGAAALVAESIGCMLAVNDATVEYLKTRKQFGVPIGKFQVLQHRAVEMFMETEQARSLAMLAAVKVDGADAGAAARAVHAAKARAAKAGRVVGQSAIQLHGGMGMTDEMAVGHYFKRLAMIEATLGDADHHLGAFAALATA
ncbi:MAG: acyl-CoA dehydrogenase family protein [Burkholderiales bacterium]|nr:acyl-CoA dehydrogenase family protein [Burkholderiales bacterium]